MKKYLLVDGHCGDCVFDNTKLCYPNKCADGKCFKLNPDWKPASQRVRELADSERIGFMKHMLLKLAAELEQEEREGEA